MFKKEKGFTLVEFLIGMALTLVIFIVATNLVISFLTVNTRSKRSQEVQQVKTDIIRLLSDQLAWGSKVTYSTNALTIDKDSYKVQNFVLYKNDIAVTPKNVKVISLQVQQFDDQSGDSTQTSYQVTILLEHSESANMTDTVSLFASSRQADVDLTTTQGN